MKKAWKAISLIVVIALILGAVCIGVGVLTGADTGRIYQVLDNRFGFEQWKLFYEQSVQAANEIIGIIAAEFAAA